MKLSEVRNIAVNQKVTVLVKAINASAPTTVDTKDGRELRKQDCKVSDVSGCVHLVLWGKDVGVVEEEKCYKFVGVGVHMFNGVNFLSVGASCNVQEISDIGKVEEEDDDDDGGIVKKVVEGEIASVLSFDEYLSCMLCKAKVVIVSGEIDECSRCKIMMKVGKCKKQATAKVMVGSNDKNYVFTLFNDMISKVTEGVGGDSMELKLLAAPVTHFNVDSRDVVYSVCRL